MRSRLRQAFSACLFLAVLGSVSLVRAAGPVFVWADTAGNLHATDRLQDVPEPYYSTYAARLKEMEKQGKTWEASSPEAAPPPAPAVAAQPSHAYSAADEEALRRRWHDLVVQWRNELTVATQALQKMQQERDEIGINPLLRETPAVREQLTVLDLRLQSARNRMMAARLMLLEGLPQKAHNEHVPLLYLR